MDETSWDIFCSKAVPDSQWFGYQVARGLVDRTQQVRLFTDAIDGLAIAQMHIDPELWVQSHAGFQLIDDRIARYTAPAKNLIQVFGTKVIRTYLGRFASQPSTGNLVQLLLPWDTSESGAAFNTTGVTSSYRTGYMKIGDLPRGAGYIKHQDRLFGQRQNSTRHRSASLLSMLGLPQELAAREASFFLSGSENVPIECWLHLLAIQEPSTAVYIDAGPLQERLARVFDLPPNSPGVCSAGSLDVVFLPPLTWYVIDELIANCDLAATTSAAIASRAAEFGTPLIYQDAAGRTAEYLDWYAPSATPGFRAVLETAARALFAGQQVEHAWTRYRDASLEVKVVAREASKRIFAAPDLSDVLKAALGGEDQGSVEGMFAPTQPNEMT